MEITHALVLSQVVLSFVLPIPMVALVRFTASRDVMGEFANTRLINPLAVAVIGFVCLLNGILLLAIAGLPIPTMLAEDNGFAGQRVSPGMTLPVTSPTGQRVIPPSDPYIRDQCDITIHGIRYYLENVNFDRQSAEPFKLDRASIRRDDSPHARRCTVRAKRAGNR
jgi:hypothetical protein